MMHSGEHSLHTGGVNASKPGGEQKVRINKK